MGSKYRKILYRGGVADGRESPVNPNRSPITKAHTAHGTVDGNLRSQIYKLIEVTDSHFVFGPAEGLPPWHVSNNETK